MSFQSRHSHGYAHQVYFQLADRTPATFSTFLQHCRTYLSNHEGMRAFTLGFRDVEERRPVNDQRFDVFMSMVFEGVEHYDKYRHSERHHQWITLAGSMSVVRRVFDAYLLPEEGHVGTG